MNKLLMTGHMVSVIMEGRVARGPLTKQTGQKMNVVENAQLTMKRANCSKNGNATK
jgi:hypothetical protein